MSKIRLTPNASGTGTVTLTVPSTSTDRTLTLPDATTTLSANMPLGYDSWYLNANQTSNGTITAWTRRPSGSGFLQIGSAMTLSSGVFTFPTTGIWLIKLNLMFQFIVTANDQFQAYVRIGTSGTIDTIISSIIEGGGGVGDMLGIARAEYLFDVTDTTNCVIAADVNSVGSGNYFVGGSTSYTFTTFEFMKLGET